MKKIIAALLCVTLLMCSLCFTAAGAPVPETDDAVYKRVTAVFKDLQIVEKDFNLIPEGFMTYREFVGYLDNLTLCPGRYDYSSYGISPSLANEVITYDAAVKIMVDLLGWSYEASNKGYASTARSLKLDDSLLNKNDAFARYDALVLIYNSLNAKYLKQVQYGDSNKYTSKESTLLSIYRDAYEFAGVLEANKWSSVYGFQGLGTDKVSINEDDLGVTEFTCVSTESIDLLGARVKGYYNIKNGTPNVLTMWCDSDYEYLTEENTPYCNLQNRTIKYTGAGGKNKEISLPIDVTVVLNGRNCADLSVINDDSFSDLEYIKVYKVDGKYSAVHIGRCTSHVVETAPDVGSALGFLNGSSVEFDENEYGETVFFYNSNGDEMSFGDIKAGDIISVFQSITNGSALPIIRVYDSGKAFLGKVTESEKSNGKDYVYVAEVFTGENGEVSYGETIKLTYAHGYDGTVESGSCYNFYIDRCGRITASEYASFNDGRLTGLFIKISPDKEKLSSKYEIFMMPNLDSEVQAGAQIFKISSDAKINYEEGGIRKTVKLKDADLDSINSVLMHTAMYYYTDADGEVAKIVGFSTQPENGYLYNFNPSGKYLGTHGVASEIIEVSKLRDDSGGKFGGGTSVSFDISKPSTYNGTNNIKYGEVSKRMIILPDIASSDEVAKSYADKYYKMVPAAKYGMAISQAVYKYNGFSHDGRLLPDYGTFVCNTEQYDVSVLTRLINAQYAFLVNSVSWVESENGSKVMKLTGMLNTTETTLYTASDKIIDAGNSNIETKYLNELSEGDVLLLQRNGVGDITMAIKICDYNPNTKTVSIPAISTSDILYRAFIDETSGDIIDEIGVTFNGTTTVDLKKVLGSKKTAYIAYPYRITKHAYQNSSLGGTFVVNPALLKEGAYPNLNPKQHEIKFGSITNVMYFDTSLRDEKGRVGKSALLNMTSYFDDPENMSKVFVYTISNEARFAVIYK